MAKNKKGAAKKDKPSPPSQGEKSAQNGAQQQQQQQQQQKKKLAVAGGGQSSKAPLAQKKLAVQHSGKARSSPEKGRKAAASSSSSSSSSCGWCWLFVVIVSIAVVVPSVMFSQEIQQLEAYQEYVQPQLLAFQEFAHPHVSAFQELVEPQVAALRKFVLEQMEAWSSESQPNVPTEEPTPEQQSRQKREDADEEENSSRSQQNEQPQQQQKDSSRDSENTIKKSKDTPKDDLASSDGEMPKVESINVRATSKTDKQENAQADEQKKAEEQQKLREEEEKKKKKEEEQRLREEEEKRKKEEQRLKEEEEKRIKEEQRLKEEAEKKKKEEQRLKEEEEKKKREEQRLKEEEEKRKKEEQRLKEEEEKRKKEEQRLKEEAEKKKKEEQRLKEEEEKKKREEQRLKEEEEQKKKKEEQRLKEEETKRKEEQRLKEEEEKRKKEQKLKKEEEKKKREEQRLKEEEERKRKEQKLREEEEKKKQEEQKLKEQEEEKKREEQRVKEAKKKEEEQRLKEEERKKKEQKLKEEEAKKAEELRLKAENEKKEREAEEKRLKEQQLKEAEKQKEASRLKEEEAAAKTAREQQQQQKEGGEKKEEPPKTENGKEAKQSPNQKDQQPEVPKEGAGAATGGNEAGGSNVEVEKKEGKGQKETPVDPPPVERSTYQLSSVTSDADLKIAAKLDSADTLMNDDKLEEAIRVYDDILRNNIASPRGHYGKALTLDKLGFKYMSNEYLEQAIEFLNRVLVLPDVPHDLIKLAGRKLADRQQFRGWGGKAMKTFKWLTQQYPEDLELLKEFGVSYMMIGQNDRARDVFRQVLEKDPNSGFAKVHLGFIIKTKDQDLEKAVALLKEGIESREKGTQDGRFFLHLGDSLLRLSREPEARKIYQEAEELGLFLSAWQRSLYNVESLTGRPWWTPEQTGYKKFFKMLEDNWETIRDEGLAQLDSKTGSFVPEDENLRDTGDWKQFTLYQQGRKKKENCDKAPKTCALIDQMPDAKGCKRGQVKFSVMSPGIHVWPHVGPTNCRLRSHLGLVVPEGPFLRVVNETRVWKEGKVMIFDDSFEHEVWHEGSELRLILIVDFWHPELTETQKRRLSAI